MAPSVFDTPIDVDDTADERVTVRTATTPPPIVLELMPVARHIYEPLDPAQEMLFPAAVDAVPGATEIDKISEALYKKVHCSPAG